MAHLIIFFVIYKQPLLIFGIFAFVLLWVIPKLARKEMRGSARGIGVGVLALALLLSTLFPFFQVAVQQAASLDVLDFSCKKFGEQHFKTVENVEGIFVSPPSPANDAGRFHENDRYAHTFVLPPLRKYHFVELDAPWAGQVQRHQVGWGTSQSQLAPTASYGVTWQGISTNAERRLGVYGDETVIFDVATRGVLARRVSFYFANPNERTAYDPPFRVCGSEKPMSSRALINGEVGESYGFITKVLKPLLFTRDEALRYYQVAAGMGTRNVSMCPLPIRVADGIHVNDVEFRRDHDALTIALKDSNDKFVCETFFHPAMVGAPSPDGPDYRVIFSDGIRWTMADVRGKAMK